MSIVISIGSNQTNNKSTTLRDNIVAALKLLQNSSDVSVLEISPLYETEPWGYIAQPNFYNVVAIIETGRTPTEFLSLIKSVEYSLGRRKAQKWSSRIIDMDIIFWNDLIINLPDLIVPHPYLHQRMFVLQPLYDLLPNLVHPVLNKNISILLSECSDESKCILVNNKIDLSDITMI